MTAYRIKKPSREKPPDDGGGSEYDKRRKEEDGRIWDLGNLGEWMLDREAENLDLEEMYERDILQRQMDELANRHTEQMRKDKKGD